MITFFKNMMVLTCVWIFFISPGLANMKAPDPFMYKKPSDLWDKEQFEATMMNAWIVFSSKEGLQLRREADDKSNITYVALFLDKFKVIEKKGRYINVENEEAPEIKGWGRIEEFIILPHAIKTEHSITHKAVLINKLKRIKGSVNTVNPLNAPHERADSTGKQLKILEFANIYAYYPNEENPTFILLGKKPFFYPFEDTSFGSITNTILGWVPSERVFTWDTREAFQPNPDRKHPIYYFNNKKDLESYYAAHPFDDETPVCSNVPSCRDDRKNKQKREILVIKPDTENQIDNSEWPPEAFRYAILEKGSDKEPFLIGVPGATPEALRIVQHIEKESQVSEVRDVIFLFDATMSMEPYLALAGKIAKDIMKKFKEKKEKLKEIGELRFGAAVYRDYADELPYQFEVIEDLTHQVDVMKQRLENIKPRRNYENPQDPAFYPEAVFQGIIHCIRGMNWKQGSRKLMIHIGDAGNHSRGQDDYTEHDIAELLIENDISYSAIQITTGEGSTGRLDAGKLFCEQTRNIIHETAQGWWDEVAGLEQDKVLPAEKATAIREDLKKLIDEASQETCCKNGLCCACGNRRWTLTCVKTNEDYEKTISKQIDKLADQLFEVKSMLEIFRMGKIPVVAKTNDSPSPKKELSFKSVSYRPQLMPGVVKSLIKRIGEDFINRLNEPAVKQKAVEYVGLEKLNMIDNPVIRKQIIEKLGTEELSKYLQADAQFFTQSYVMMSRPGDRYKESPDQMLKMVIFQKKELERLLQPLTIFKEKYHCQLHPGNIKRIWRDFMLAILGESDDQYIDQSVKNSSFEELYEKQYGISLRKVHPLLKISYANIDQGMLPDNVDIQALQKYLCNSQRELKKIYDSEERFFKVFGDEYIWIDAAMLP